jgi:hypothetical protein
MSHGVQPLFKWCLPCALCNEAQHVLPRAGVGIETKPICTPFAIEVIAVADLEIHVLAEDRTRSFPAVPSISTWLAVVTPATVGWPAEEFANGIVALRGRGVRWSKDIPPLDEEIVKTEFDVPVQGSAGESGYVFWLNQFECAKTEGLCEDLENV